MNKWLSKLRNEKIVFTQFLASLLLILITITSCFLGKGVPEEEGIVSAAISISFVIFMAVMSFRKIEPAERILFAFLGSFMAGFAATLAGSRLAFDPSIRSYFLASLALSFGLSFSCILYAMPENPNIAGAKLKSILVWVCTTVLAILVNFTIIYWLPTYID
ncbi:MAG: hypothetical protein QXX94_04525 [Candidatus Bathyarchaeia archaeon]